MSMSSPPARITPAAWDQLRLSFQGSMMIETSLVSLAQNIDGCVWPLDEADERPSAYIGLDHAGSIARLRARGQPASRLDDLAEILRGTLAFDESFGEMVEIAGAAEAASDPVLRNLEKLGIPSDFPLRLGNFPPAMLQFCARECIQTLGDFLAFSRGASRQVIVGGEFRELLNAIAHIDEQTIARFLHYRPKTAGLYLVESFGLLVRPLSVEERVRIARNPGSADGELHAQATERVAYFRAQAEHLSGLVGQGLPLSRAVVSLEDLSMEGAVAALLGHHLGFAPAQVATVQAAAPAVAKVGFWRRLFGRAG
jgi:hypothetical protein